MIPCFLCFAILLFSNLYPAACSDEESGALRTYIVFVGRPDDATIASLELLAAWHRSFLPEAAANSSQSRIIYSYSDAISGFAARLSEKEVEEMAKKDGFLKALPDQIVHLHTTHTPAFLGLQPGNGFWKGSGFGKGVIIGMFDSGIAPLHPSFDDSGVPPPPPHWKGSCAFKGPSGRCNNKLIGARVFLHGSDGKKLPFDGDGHGTHTASTAAGNFVPGAELLGNLNGTAAGMAPHAHLAIYKVCPDMDAPCDTSDVLAGIDAAIRDGVDVMSISLGTNQQVAYYNDPLAAATFAATRRGIFVSCSAGNLGPFLRSVTNTCPWALTVGASNIDRRVRAIVKLGDGQEFEGQSMYQPHDFSPAPLPLVFPNEEDDTLDCFRILNTSHVKKKIVLCGLEGGTPVQSGEEVKRWGGAAMILHSETTEGYNTFAELHVLPASHVGSSDGLKIRSYIKSASNPTASISFKGTIIGTSGEPSIPFFSARGPNRPSPGILKPDITGPGVGILAAWPSQVGPPNPKHSEANFNAFSGTSMSAPHLSGIAAIVKSMHPDWSPAVIKSAIMTTADTRNNNGEWIKDEQHQPASFFFMGAGHVNPAKAADPGLVYDLDVEDYVAYLCGLGYNDDQVEYITGRRVACGNIKTIKEADLNYPSIVVQLSSGAVSVNRTLTNVGDATATYKVEVEMKMPSGMSVTINPETLWFSKINEKLSFTVRVNIQKGQFKESLKWVSDKQAVNITKGQFEGSLKWVSNKHVVTSPIIILSD